MPGNTQQYECAGFDPETGEPCSCSRHKPPKGTDQASGPCRRCGHKKALHKGKPNKVQAKSKPTVDDIFKNIITKDPRALDHMARFRDAQDETSHGLKNKGSSTSKEPKPSKV
jgi:hypothetical protein